MENDLTRTLAIGLLVLTATLLPSQPNAAGDFVVHEWGVFTVFNDVKLANANRREEWGELPSFFYRQFPKERLRWVPSAWDKPIIYVHAKPKAPKQLKVKAPVPVLGFGQGHSSWEMQQRRDLTTTAATMAASTAFKMAGAVLIAIVLGPNGSTSKPFCISSGTMLSRITTCRGGNSTTMGINNRCTSSIPASFCRK